MKSLATANSKDRRKANLLKAAEARVLKWIELRSYLRDPVRQLATASR
jgi:hypothetical protein